MAQSCRETTRWSGSGILAPSKTDRVLVWVLLVRAGTLRNHVPGSKGDTSVTTRRRTSAVENCGKGRSCMAPGERPPSEPRRAYHPPQVMGGKRQSTRVPWLVSRKATWSMRRRPPRRGCGGGSRNLPSTMRRSWARGVSKIGLGWVQRGAAGNRARGHHVARGPEDAVPHGLVRAGQFRPRGKALKHATRLRSGRADVDDDGSAGSTGLEVL